MPTIASGFKLSNGVRIPCIGLGTWQVPDDHELIAHIHDAIEIGYRHIDTAQSYFNEEEVGRAIRKSGIPREELFITTKVWIEHYGYEECRKSVLESLRKLQLDYIDLVLLHQPFADYYGAWRALEELYAEGKLRAIGVSNFYPDRLVDLCSFSRIRPMVNQVETHPHNQQKAAHEWMSKYGVVHEAWAPFGEGRGGLFTDPVLIKIGEKYGIEDVAVVAAWILRHPANMQMITGTMKEKRLAAIAKGADVTITREEWYKIYIAAGHILP